VGILGQPKRLVQASAGVPQDGPEWFSELTEDQLSFDEAVRVLCEHALVEADVTLQDDRIASQEYSMHSCVHLWTVHVVNQGFDAKMGGLALNV
jgi:hypothetical protein